MGEIVIDKFAVILGLSSLFVIPALQKVNVHAEIYMILPYYLFMLFMVNKESEGCPYFYISSIVSIELSFAFLALFNEAVEANPKGSVMSYESYMYILLSIPVFLFLFLCLFRII